MGVFEDLKDFKEILYKVRGSILFVHTNPLVNSWIEWSLCNEKNNSISMVDVRKRMQEVPGFISHSKAVRINGKVYRCSMFHLSKVPQSLKKLINIKEEE